MGLNLNYAEHVLRPLRLEDGELILSWRNHENVRAYMYTDHIITKNEHNAWLEKVLTSDTQAYFIFEKNEEPIGNVGFYNIDTMNKSAEWNFHIHPDGAARGSGAAMEYFALEHYFDSMNMRKLNCEVLDFNQPVVRLHKRFGFEEEGLRKDHVWKNDKWCDVHEMSMFNTNWHDHKKAYYDMLF